MIDPSAVIHHLAHVENSDLGENTRVWQFASVIRRAVIGNSCRVAAGAVIDGATVGDRTIISNGAHLNPGTWVGTDVFIGPHVVTCNDAWPRVSKEGFELELINGLCIVKICDGASIGANAVVLPGITIGAHAMVAAGSVVDRSVPTGCLFRRTGTIDRIDVERFSRRVKEVK